MTHKFNKDIFVERSKAKKELQEPHTPPQSVPSLRNRLDKVERLIGVVAVIE